MIKRLGVVLPSLIHLLDVKLPDQEKDMFYNRSQLLCAFLFALFMVPSAFGQKKAIPFEFQYEGKTLHGLIEQPVDRPPTAIIIMIPGYGPTNFVKGNWYAALRDQFVDFGLAVCFWDKMGCGDSEGEFDANQPVQSSAAEALVAIKRLQKMPAYSRMKMGLWGVSRAGWICPLIIDQHPIDFWISASGTDDKETYGYLLRSNLIIHGKSEVEAQALYEAWQEGHRIFCTEGTYEEAEQAIAPLKKDSLCRELFGYKNDTIPSEEKRQAYYLDQRNFTAEGHFDSESGLWVYLPGFDALLSRMECPVLAVFGEQDSQVDWQRTRVLYKRTLGQREPSELTIKTFSSCNHNLQKCDTCAMGEDLSKYGWQACDGYYETMRQWLNELGVIN